MKKMSEKKQDKLIEQCYRIHGNGVQVNMMDLGKIFAMGRAALEAGASLDDAMISAVAKFRQN